MLTIIRISYIIAIVQREVKRNMSDNNNYYTLIDKEEYEKYKKLKKFILEASDKIDFVRMLFIFIDLLDNDLYDYNELLTEIRMTVTDLYNYSLDCSNMLNDYLKQDN